MELYNKYLKYKNKYLKLKSQIGGIIESNKFIDPSDIKSGIENDDEFICQLLTYFYSNKKSKILINMVENNWYKNLDIIIQISHLMGKHLLEYIEKNNHTILLVPGNSPTYFMFIIKLLYPEQFKNNIKLTIIEFPISSLNNISENYDGTPYFNFLLNNYVNPIILHNEHKYINFDYYESGDSAEYIKTQLFEIYKKYNYCGYETFETNSFIYFNIGDYFNLNSTTVEIYNKAIKGNETRKDIIRTEILPPFIVDQLPEDYPDNLVKIENKERLLTFFISDEADRCQYSMNITKALNFVKQKNINPSLTFDTYLKSLIKGNQSIIDSELKKFNNLYIYCNHLYYLFYIYIQNPEKIKKIRDIIKV
jgi:hypothetical protein